MTELENDKLDWKHNNRGRESLNLIGNTITVIGKL